MCLVWQFAGRYETEQPRGRTGKKGTMWFGCQRKGDEWLPRERGEGKDRKREGVASAATCSWIKDCESERRAYRLGCEIEECARGMCPAEEDNMHGKWKITFPSFRRTTKCHRWKPWRRRSSRADAAKWQQLGNVGTYLWMCIRCTFDLRLLPHKCGKEAEIIGTESRFYRFSEENSCISSIIEHCVTYIRNETCKIYKYVFMFQNH